MRQVVELTVKDLIKILLDTPLRTKVAVSSVTYGTGPITHGHVVLLKPSGDRKKNLLVFCEGPVKEPKRS